MAFDDARTNAIRRINSLGGPSLDWVLLHLGISGAQDCVRVIRVIIR